MRTRVVVPPTTTNVANSANACPHGEIEPRPVSTKASVTTGTTGPGSRSSPLGYGGEKVSTDNSRCHGGPPVIGRNGSTPLSVATTPLPGGSESTGTIVVEVCDLEKSTLKVAN